MIKVAFVCVHNSCRSQMAEALAKIMGKGVMEVYSAGTEAGSFINPDAVNIIFQRYGIDIRVDQRSKTIEEIPEVDVVITMGCNVNCPSITAKYKEDWGLDDPSGKELYKFEETLNIIESKMKNLIYRIEAKEFG